MKTLYRIFYKLTHKNYIQLIESAKMTSNMINDSTYGKISHFYDLNGDKIRGYHKHIKFTSIPQHPLIQQYR